MCLITTKSFGNSLSQITPEFTMILIGSNFYIQTQKLVLAITEGKLTIYLIKVF